MLLVLLLCTLTPLAFADPPDPLWIGGLWDDDDFDDVIYIVTGQLHAVAIVLTLDAQPRGRPIPLEEVPAQSPPAVPCRTADARAPPSTSSL